MLSVIIPAHNEEQYLRFCLDLLKNQSTGMKYELIVVENASTDGTFKIAKKSGVNVIREPEIGVSRVKNRGVNQAKYSNLLFIDADCQVLPGYLHKVSTIFFNKSRSSSFWRTP
jgi:glycosyltransferase involved in cell wall biosynthesis